MIGGRARDKTKTNGKCSTYGYNCTLEGSTDNFRCAAIYGSVCVKRKKITNLSDRCHKAANDQGKMPSKAQYSRIKETLQNIIKGLCSGDNLSSPCRNLIEQFAKVKKEYEAETASTPPCPSTSTNPPPEPVSSPAPTGTRTSGLSCVKVSDGKNCDGTRPGEDKPQYSIKNATFGKSYKFMSDLCKVGKYPHTFTVSDDSKYPVKMRFYKDDKNRVCQKIIVPDRKLYKNYDAYKSSRVEFSCDSFLDCSKNGLERVKKHLNKVSLTNGANQVCQNTKIKCNEDEVLNKCTQFFNNWNKLSCPGGDLTLIANKLNEMTESTNNFKDIDENKESELRRICKKYMYKREPDKTQICSGKLGELIKNYSYFNFKFSSRTDRPWLSRLFNNLDSMNNITNLGNYLMKLVLLAR